MKATIENGCLVLRIPMNATPIPSASGQTLVVDPRAGVFGSNWCQKNAKTREIRSFFYVGIFRLSGTLTN